MIKINFFLNVLSIHQAPLIRKLSDSYHVNVFYDKPLSSHRKSLGWDIPEFGQANIYSIESINEYKLLDEMTSDTVNIFSGLNAYPSIHKLLKKCLRTNASNYVQIESLKLDGIKGAIRKIKYKILAFNYNNQIDGILTQGGKIQLEKIGFNNVQEFVYYIDGIDDYAQIKNEITKFVYIGALSKNKRILELISLFPKNSCCSLDIYGSELDVSLNTLRVLINSNPRITYKGVIPNKEVMKTLTHYDYLILPSKTEGWGVVVSEALLSGVGVIVTETAGISGYIHNKFSNHVHIEDFSKENIISELLRSLSPLEPNDRKVIQKEAYFLSSEYGVEFITEYLT
ncbi:glycosyltransferase [Psychrobacter pacificensis]|uniref:glycosyltransferase n=1 Tax=Psychrobacter pacificensis TaxID=112002 RepID=UPI0028C4BB38|nr:glycosyltransferase [Psychrobacter pacificensis]